VASLGCLDASSTHYSLIANIAPDLSFSLPVSTSLSFFKREENDRMGELANLCQRILPDVKADLSNSENTNTYGQLKQFNLTSSGKSFIMINVLEASPSVDGRKMQIIKSKQYLVHTDTSYGEFYLGLVKSYTEKSLCPSPTKNTETFLNIELGQVRQ
jgi:hypothetical protein